MTTSDNVPILLDAIAGALDRHRPSYALGLGVDLRPP